MEYKIEYQTGQVSINSANLLVKDILDMETLEFWEHRLTQLKQPFIVAYREMEGKVYYSIFTNIRQKGSAFR
jgi:hypothetical protein